MSTKYPEKRRAALMLVAQGLSQREAALRVGVSRGTLAAWVNPAVAAKARANSLAAKRKRQGTCLDCGTATRYSGAKDGRTVGDRCVPCDHAFRRANIYWTAERVVAAIQRWASEHDGQPPSATQWTKAVGGFPAKSQVYRGSTRSSQPFAAWADAIEAAGFPRPGMGRRRKNVARSEI